MGTLRRPHRRVVVRYTGAMQELCDDLTAEHDALDALVADLDDVSWDLPPPAEGWSIRDQISHLWYFDNSARLSLTDPEAFAAARDALLAGGEVDADVREGRAATPAVLLASWRRDRRALVDAARGVDPRARVEWYGPAMSARSFLTARLMETWAHGQDVADALGVERAATARLRHVAHIGVTARPWSYLVSGLDLPADPVRVALTAPDGTPWTWGDEGAAAEVHGPALDFCLVVTQRRHVDDTALVTVGDIARQWMLNAQAFAGPKGPGRPPTTDR